MIFICLPVQTWELNQPASQPALEPDNTGRPDLWRPGPQLSPSSLHFSTSEFQLKLSGQVVYIFQPKIVNFLPDWHHSLEDDLACIACGVDTTHWEKIIFFFLHTHSHPPAHLREFSQDRIGSSESSLNSWGS